MRVAAKRVRRLMKAFGLEGVSRTSSAWQTSLTVRLPVSGRCAGCVESADRRLIHGHSLAH